VQSFLTISILLIAIIYLAAALWFTKRRNRHLEEVLARARKGYKRYIGSAAWKLVATLSKRRDKYTCRICGRKHPVVSVESHHPKNYDEVLYDERPEDLTTLCHDCHVAATTILALRKMGLEVNDALHPDIRPQLQASSAAQWGSVRSKNQTS